MPAKRNNPDVSEWGSSGYIPVLPKPAADAGPRPRTRHEFNQGTGFCEICGGHVSHVRSEYCLPPPKRPAAPPVPQAAPRCPTCKSEERDMPYLGDGKHFGIAHGETGTQVCPDTWHNPATYAQAYEFVSRAGEAGSERRDEIEHAFVTIGRNMEVPMDMRELATKMRDIAARERESEQQLVEMSIGFQRYIEHVKVREQELKTGLRLILESYREYRRSCDDDWDTETMAEASRLLGGESK